MDENLKIPHSIVIDNREKLSAAGIKNVISFDDETLLLDSVMGRITVKGENLHIESFDTQSGDLSAEGKIQAVVYMNEVRSGSFISRFFR